MRRSGAAILGFVLWLSTWPAHAVKPDEMLADPALEARARAVGLELRCLVCQNQSIDDSDAELAHDLRVLLRERIKAGDTDAQAKQYLVARYGNYVLLKPPFNTETLLLWFGPLLLLAAASVVVWPYFRKGRAQVPEVPPLNPEERQRLAALLKDDPAP